MTEETATKFTPAGKQKLAEAQGRSWKENRVKRLEARSRQEGDSPVRALRIALGLNQRQFADRLGMGSGPSAGQTIGQYEKGLRVPAARIEVMKTLAQQHGLSFDPAGVPIQEAQR